MEAFSPLGGAKWITPNDSDCQSPVIRKEFNITKIVSCTLFITGLGYFEARINGTPVTEDRLVPLASDYERRAFKSLTYPIKDSFTHRIYYCRYDTTKLLRAGENTLAIQLGNGWYRQTERLAEGEMEYGTRLKAIYALRFDGMPPLMSDGSEVWFPSEITENNIFTGEVQDARISEDEKHLRSVEVLPAPDSILSEQTAPADRFVRSIQPVCLYRDGGRSLWDAGENGSGVVRVSGYGRPGEKIRLRFAERIRGNELDFSTVGASYVMRSERNQIMEDTFICGRNKRSFTPKFVWHAFRYFELIGPGESPEVLVLHSDVPVTSYFDSDGEGWNFLYDAFIRTQLANMHGGFPSDCPHRERLGYTGDGQAAAAGGMLLLDSREFYRKWIQDILDCQDIAGGHVQHTAPFMGGGGGPGGWGCAIVIVPYLYYRTYGETAMLEKCYPAMVKWVGYLQAHSEKGLVVREEEGGWCLGDWCTPEKLELLDAFVNICYFIHSLELMKIIAVLLHRPSAEIAYYDRLTEELRGAVKREYYDESTRCFCGGKQGADAYAAWVGLADDGIVAAMAERYRAVRRFDTGFLGTAILCEVLFSRGYGDVVDSIMENDSMGTFLYMKRQDATTIWEHWNGGSNCHPMFGGCVSVIFNYLLGIRPADAYASDRRLTIAPFVPAGMTRASGGVVTMWGKIESAWERTACGIRFRVAIPDDIDASFRYGSLARRLDAGVQDIFYREGESCV